MWLMGSQLTKLADRKCTGLNKGYRIFKNYGHYSAFIKWNKVIRHCTFDLMALDNGRGGMLVTMTFAMTDVRAPSIEWFC